MKRLLFTAVAAAMPSAIFWLGAGEFVRGMPLAVLAVVTTYTTCAMYYFPNWK